MVEPVRHRRTKGAATDMFHLTPPRHISTLPMCGRLRVGKSFLHVLQHWSVQPCVRPFNAAHMTAGHNALRGSGPDQTPHLTMLRPKWVVLIAGSTGSALRAVRPPNLRITPVARRDLVYRASATGSLYRSPLAIRGRAEPKSVAREEKTNFRAWRR